MLPVTDSSPALAVDTENKKARATNILVIFIFTPFYFFTFSFTTHHETQNSVF
jgi:hypothetical protein